MHNRLIFITLKDYSHIILLMKNTSPASKDTTLISVLQGHFRGELNTARVKLICLFITALCKIKTINYSNMTAIFNINVKKKSAYPFGSPSQSHLYETAAINKRSNILSK